MKCLCLPDPVHGARHRGGPRPPVPQPPGWPGAYRVHEQILPALRRLGGEVRWSDVTIRHTGYQDPALRGRKLERDLRLLRLELDEQGDEPFVLFNLGMIHQEQGDAPPRPWGPFAAAWRCPGRATPSSASSTP